VQSEKGETMPTVRPLFILAALLVFLSGSLCRAQASLAGEWEGVLETGGNEVHLAWHVTAAPDGTITTTFDNKDEGVMGIKAKITSFKDSKLSIAVDDQVEVNGQALNIRGSFEGTVSADGSEVSGTWTQTDPQEEAPMELHFKRAAAPAAPAAAAPKG
jgi:hypothetical protein